VFAGGVVALAGSRSLPAGGARLVSSVVGDLVASGCQLVCGCATGADAAVISSAPVSALRVFAAFGPDGSGSAGSVSAVSVVRQFARRGGWVGWWSGGQRGLLRVRLAARTRAVVSAADAGLVVFPASPSARGSWLAARLAVGRGLPVVAFPLGFLPSALPSLGAGRWVAVGAPGVWASAWRWAHGQAGLW
jgi:predicted Rossmann fold nucleotide-binding protein DprA/Smf involved in DNA uptake